MLLNFFYKYKITLNQLFLMSVHELLLRDSNSGYSYKLNYDEISYISIDRYLLKYHTTRYGDLYVATGILCRCCSLLPTFFCRLNRNLVVNMKFIEMFSLNEKFVCLSGISTPFKISSSGVKRIKHYYEDYINI